MQLIRIELNDVPTAICAIENPYQHSYDLVIVVQSCGTVSVFKMGHHQTVLEQVSQQILEISTVHQIIQVT